MRILRLTAILPLALASVAPTGRAQTDSRQSAPALVADSFFRATSAERWNDAVQLIDLEAIARIRDQEVRNARRMQRRTAMTADQFLRVDPKMPREVAEYQAKRANESVHDETVLEFEFARVASVDSLAALPVREVAARWLEARGMRWQVHRSLAYQRKTGCDLPDSLENALLSSVRTTAPRIHGAIIEDSLAWVLHDEPGFAEEPGRDVSPRRAGRAVRDTWVIPPRVTTLRLVGGAWRVMPGIDGSQGMAVSAECKRTDAATPTPPR